MMRAVIAFQLTIGKRENPFRHSETGFFFFFYLPVPHKRVDYCQISFDLKRDSFVFIDL